MNEAGNNPSIRAETVPVHYYDRIGSVYFVSDGTAIKIGFSMNPYDRIATLRMGTPRDLEILGIFTGTLSEEQRLHHRLRHFRLHGEWFEYDPEIIQVVTDLENIRRKKTNQTIKEYLADGLNPIIVDVVAPVPAIVNLPPAKVRREWMIRIASGKSPEGQAAIDAEYVALAINEYNLNFGKQGEELSRKNLAQRIATFEAHPA